MPSQNDLQLIQNIITRLDANPVARFSYTQDAFDNDIIEGVDVFDASAEQNIPKADKTDYDQTVINKGVRAQGASISRMGWNHYVGRPSFNLNKLVQKFLAFLGLYRASLSHNAAEYDSSAAYKTGDVCYTIETVEDVKVYTWYQRKSLTPGTISNIPPAATLHWEEMQSKTSSSALLPFSAPGYRHKFTVVDLTGANYNTARWYPVTTKLQDFEAKAGQTKEGVPQVLIEAFCNGAVSGRNSPHRAELAVLSKFTGFADSSTDIVINNAFVDQEDGTARPLADSPIGYSKLAKGRQAVVWFKGGTRYALWNSFGSDFELHNTQYANGLDNPVDVADARPFDIIPGLFKARVKSTEAFEKDDAVIKEQVDGAISMPKTLNSGAQLNTVRTPGSYVVTDEALANTVQQAPVDNPGAFELVVRGDKAGLSVTTQQFTVRATGEEFTRILSGNEVVIDWYLSGSPTARMDGFSPEITVETDASKVYRLCIEDVKHTFTTPNLRGQDAFSPEITVETDTPKEYRLRVEDAEHSFVTPNLIAWEGIEAVAEALAALKNETETGLSLKAPIASPVFTGTPKVPGKTAAAANDGTLIATEAQVKTVADSNALKAPIASPVFTGTPKVPGKTAAAANDGTLIATEAQVKTVADSNALKAPIASPVFTGTPKVPGKTAAAANDGTLIATEAQVKTVADSNALKAPIASPALTGTPTAPTAATATNSTQIATTAFAHAAAKNDAWPVGSFYTQYPLAGQSTIANMFPSSGSPATLFGGTWTEMYAGEKVFFMGGLSSVESNRSSGIQQDAIRNITGQFEALPQSADNAGFIRNGSGAFTVVKISGYWSSAQLIQPDRYGDSANFDASRVVSTDSTNHPKNRPVKVWRRTA